MSNTREQVKKGQTVSWETNGHGVKRSWTGTVVYVGPKYVNPLDLPFVRKHWWKKSEYNNIVRNPGTRKGMTKTMPDGIIVKVETDEGVRYMTPRLGSLS